MAYGEVSKFEGRNWEFNGERFDGLREAKAAAVAAAIQRLERDGYVLTDAKAAPTGTPSEGESSTTGNTAPTKLDDFGEKLEGARKDLPPSLKEELSDDQIASRPLSKIWPADAHEGIEDDTAAALTFAARAEIPAKPRKSYKLNRWVDLVKMLRDVVRHPDDARRLIEKGESDGRFSSHGGFFAKVRLLAQLPRETWKRVEKVGEYPGAHRYEGGERVSASFSEVQIDGKTHRFPVGKIGPDEVQAIRELLGTAAPTKDGLTAKDFEIRGPRSGGSAFINRKGDSEYRALKTFTGDDAVKQARAWLNANVAEAEAAWEAVKARDNIAMGDERRDENRERTGPNRRNGKDVTPEMFNEAFGFRGTQFGNWVSQGKGAKDRQGMLNEAYDALLDLAELLGIPSRAISLNGTLGLAFGARGKGNAGAHFEPSNLVINLTKNLAEKNNDAARKQDDADPKQIAAADALLTELKKRHEWIMNPTNSKLASTATSLGFVYYLGLTPAAALVNLTQVAQTTLPFLAAHPDIGLTKAGALVTSAMKDALRTGGDIKKTLTKPEERLAYRELVKRGAIDKSLSHNLAGLSEGDSTQYNPVYAKVMNIISFLFHKAEVVNRETTGMAAFRAMRQAGKSFDEAVQFATDTIWKTQFNYQNAHRPRWMQSDVAKVLLLFKQYSQNMTWFLGRNVYQALKGETKAVRKQAMKTLAGTLGMTGIMAGAMGMPLLPIVFTVLNAVAASFGDDDEYFDAETEFRNFLADRLGRRGGRIVTEGVVNELTGANIAGRVGLSDLWVREPNRELEGRDAFAYWLEQLAGPVIGGMGSSLFVGKQLMDEGHLMRGWETILPKAFRDGIKAYRFATEGVNTLRGDPVIEGVSPWQVAMQASGFSLAEASAQYDVNNAAMKFETHVIGRRQALMDAYAMALRMDDLQAHAKVIEAIGRFNAKYPELGITGRTLRTSMKARQRYSDRSEGGVVLNPNLAGRSREQARFGASP